MIWRHRWEDLSAVMSVCGRCGMVRLIRPQGYPYAKLWVREYAAGDGMYIGVRRRAPMCRRPRRARA